MPTENININLVGSEQPQSILTSGTSKDSSTSTVTSSGTSFEQILADETESQATTDTETSETTTEKPCIAQFMVMTGCDVATASKALYQYGNWQDYLSDSTPIPDLSEAQVQLSYEVSSGTRKIEDGSFGQRQDYIKPEPFTTDTPGKVVPAFDEQGNVTGLGLVTNFGEQKTILSMTDRDTIIEATDGFHIGRQALDSFAQKVTGNSSCTFAELDLQQVRQNFLNKKDWESKFGADNSWYQHTDEEDTANQEVASLWSKCFVDECPSINK